MKKLLLLIFVLFSFIGYSQMEGKNEIKANLPYFVFAIPEISYERILDQNSALGVSLAISFEDDFDTQYIFTPYYRMYFGGDKAKARAMGFFIEADLVVANQLVDEYSDNATGVDKYSTNMGFGAAVGVKLLNRNGYFGEVFLGVSRVFGVDTDNTDATEFYPRAGINIGKRFN